MKTYTTPKVEKFSVTSEVKGTWYPEKKEYLEKLLLNLVTLNRYGENGKHLAEVYLAENEEKLKCMENNVKRQREEQQKRKKLNEDIRNATRNRDFDSAVKLVEEARYNTLDSETADVLSEAGRVDIVIDHFYYFEGFGNTTYDKIRENDKFFEVVEKVIDRFPDHNYIVNRIIENGEIHQYCCNIKYRGLNNETFQNLLSNLGSRIFEMEIDEKTFTGLDKKSFKDILDKTRYYTNYYKLGLLIKSFKDLDKESFLYVWKRLKLKEKETIYSENSRYIESFKKSILNNIKIFKLDTEVAEILIKDGYFNVVTENSETFGLTKEK